MAEYGLPEGLRRERKGPLNKSTGRGAGHAHVLATFADIGQGVGGLQQFWVGNFDTLSVYNGRTAKSDRLVPWMA